MFNDDKGFDRQRRNVILSSVILILAVVATAPGQNDLSQITVLGLNLHFKPCLVGFLWACMILYFMLRLYQMPIQEQNRHPMTLWRNTFLLKLLGTSGWTLQHRKLIRNRLEGFAEEHPEYKKSEIKVRLVEWGAQQPDVHTGDITYWPLLEYRAGRLLGPVQLRTAEGVTIRKHGLIWCIAVVRNFISLSFRTEYFTEYLLPYMLGLLAIAWEATRYISCVANCYR